MFPFFFFFLFACNQRFTRFPFLSSRSLFPTRFNLTLPPPRRILFSSRFRRFTRKAPKIVHILHKIEVATADAVQIGLFLLSAIAYLKIAFYLCTSNQPKGVARSFLVLRYARHASATHEELKTAYRSPCRPTHFRPAHAAVWGDSEDGRDLTENQFIFIYEME